MTFRRLMILGALASCSLLAAGAHARADYTYSTSAPTAVPPTIPGLGETFAANTGTVPDSSPAGPSFVTFMYNPTTIVVGASQTLSFTETLATVGGGPTETFNITGTLMITAAAPAAVLANFSNVSITQVSGSGFSLSFIGYAAQPGTLGKTADISFGIVPNAFAVPEPASMALLGTGLVGALGLGLRRSRARA